MMSDAVFRRVEDLCVSMRMLTAVIASARLRSSVGYDPTIRHHIDRARDLALGAAAEEFTTADVEPLLTMLNVAFAEASDLLRDPGREAGWRIVDPDLLQAMGRASAGVFDRIVALANTNASLRRTLTGTFLDVGTGVGGIALRAVEICHELNVDAIDIWEPALRLARLNVAASTHADRVRVLKSDVTELRPVPRYTLAWLPTMYLSRTTLKHAIRRIAAASVSDSWVVAAVYTVPADPFSAAVTSIRTLRGGGEITDPTEIEDLLRSHGYVDIVVDAAPFATFILARLP